MSRDKAIELGRRAYQMEGDARWMYGDAIVEYGWKPGTSGSDSGNSALIDGFRNDLADTQNLDIKILPSIETLRVCATSAYNFTAPEREGVDVHLAYEAVRAVTTGKYRGTPHQLIAQSPKGKKGKVTVTSLREGLGLKGTHTPPAARDSFRSLPKEERREVIKEALGDPDVVADDSVVEAIEQSQPINKRMNERFRERVQERENRAEQIKSEDPVSQRIDKDTAAIDMEEACRKFANAMADVLPRMGDMPKDRILARSVDRAIDAADALRTLRDTGRTDIDAFLDTVFSEGN